MSASLLLLPLLQAPPAQGMTVATCRSVGLAEPRAWRVEPVDGHWQIAHWTGSSDQRAVRVRLPAATVVRLSATEVYVKGRTSNGGIDVSLAGPPASATLDIYVSYELEVNVDTSLTPAIDDLNTEGPIGVRCEVSAR